jgi:hypothetical protein
MADRGAAPSQKVEVHVGESKPQKEKMEEETYPNLPPRFLPREGYELVGSLVRVNKEMTESLLKLLKGTELVQNDESPTGYSEVGIKGVKPFCNADGVIKVLSFITLHVNTPLSYREKGQTATLTAGELAKQFNKDIAANYEHWEIHNPSLIPQLVAIAFQFIRAAQGQNTELPEDLLAGGALRPRTPSQSEQKEQPKFRIR